MADHNYTADSIKSLDWKEHIRLRPGMYIGKLGDGSSDDDGIYVLLKEVLDNCIDEFVMGAGKTVEVNIREGEVMIRDYGRGIPLGKVVDVVEPIKFKSEGSKASFVVGRAQSRGALLELATDWKFQFDHEFDSRNIDKIPHPEISYFT